MYFVYIQYSKLYSAFQQIKNIKSKSRKKKSDFILQLVLNPDQLLLDASGMEFTIQCKFEGVLTLLVPFQSFFMLVQDIDTDWTKLEFDNSYITYGNRRI